MRALARLLVFAALIVPQAAFALDPAKVPTITLGTGSTGDASALGVTANGTTQTLGTVFGTVQGNASAIAGEVNRAKAAEALLAPLTAVQANTSAIAGEILRAKGAEALLAPLFNPNFSGVATIPALALSGGGSTGDVSGMSVTVGGTTRTLAAWLPAIQGSTSPVFTGTVTAPNISLTGAGSSGDVSGMSATPSSGAASNTLARILADQAAQIGGKAPLASPVFTGPVTAQSLALTGPGSSGDVSGMTVTPSRSATMNTLALITAQLQAAALPEFPLTNAGVYPDTGADVSGAIIAAAQTLPASGARLKFACGVYLFSSTVALPNPSLWVQGGGQNCTTIRSTAGFTTGDVLKLTGLKSGVSDIAFEHVATDTNAVRTGGFTVNLANGYSYIRNVSMRNCFICIRMGSQVGWNSVDHVMLQYMADGGTNPGSGGILVQNDVVGPANWIDHVVIMSNFVDPIAANRRYPTFAVKLEDTGETFISHSDFISVRSNLLIQPSNAAFLASPGAGYVAGNTLTVTGGTLASGRSATTITVTSVNGSGAITGYSLSNPGGYTVLPSQIAGVNAGGSGYAVGDVVTMVGGTLAAGGSPLRFTVTSVGSGGAITGVTPSGCCSYTVQSTYTAAPPNPASLSGGSGSGGQLTLGNTTGGAGTGAAFTIRGQTVQATKVTATALDSAQRDNVAIVPIGSGYVFDTAFANSWITNTNASDGTLNTNGIVINGSNASLLPGISTPIIGTRWTNGLIASTAGQSGSGIQCSDASPIDTTISAAVIAGWSVGVDLAPGCGHVTVSDNSIGAYSPFNVGAVGSSARTNGIGVRVQGGSGDYIDIHDNRLFGNTVAPLGFNGTGTHSRVTGNLGYNPVGAVNLTVGASPWTFTNGATPASLSIVGGSGVAAVTRAADNSGNLTVCNTTPCTVSVAPFQAVQISYTSGPSVVQSIQ